MAQTPIRVGATPTHHPDGTLRVQGTTSPVGFKVRHGVPLGPEKVIPVIFVPGIMGSNLITVPQNPKEQPELAWRPPNGNIDGLKAEKEWGKRDPARRQALLNPDTTAVDEAGPIEVGTIRQQVPFRQRGWGTVHHDSYGKFLFLLHNDLNHTLETKLFSSGMQPCSHWLAVMQADRTTWDAADMPALTQTELEKFADYQYPVYAVGYNWLQSNAKSAEHLARKIDGWMAEWRNAKYHCDQVILVSHSMGGLVCRAYAKLHPGKVLGVVHGAQPAVGAPACYRRMTCGTEQSSPSNGWVGNETAAIVATILGRTPAETQPVMGVSPGALELLPCHLHPPGWLQVNVSSQKHPQPKTVLALPEKDPYAEIYRNTNAWYRLIDPALLDPAGRYTTFAPGGGLPPGPLGKFIVALGTAEKFHRVVLGNYYHPNTFAFYGHDAAHQSFGSVRWQGRWIESDDLDENLLRTAPAPQFNAIEGCVSVELGTPGPIARQGHLANESAFEGSGAVPSPLRNPTIEFVVQPQDVPGDGTVAWASGRSPNGQAGVQRVFRTTGFDHQGAYDNGNMRQLTCHLICKIVQGAA